MFRFLAHVAVAAVVGIATFYLYRTVLPQQAAAGLGVVLAMVELVSFLATKRHGRSLSLTSKVATPLLVWPILAIILERAFHFDWATGMSVAAIGAVATGFLAAGRGSGGESLRLAGAGIATLIAMYAMVASVVTNASMPAMAAASVAVAVAALVVYQAGVWPGRHERALLWAAGACGCIAAVWAAADVLALAVH